jgi:P27 family predicted phage terminase small subunit
MKGRKPVPTALRVIRGNPSKRPLLANEPPPPPLDGKAAAPAWLDKQARLEWQRLAPLLAETGLLTVLDVDALAAYCVTVVEWRTATDEFTKRGIVVKSPTGHMRPSPYIVIRNRAESRMRRSLLTSA